MNVTTTVRARASGNDNGKTVTAANTQWVWALVQHHGQCTIRPDSITRENFSWSHTSYTLCPTGPFWWLTTLFPGAPETKCSEDWVAFWGAEYRLIISTHDASDLIWKRSSSNEKDLERETGVQTVLTLHTAWPTWYCACPNHVLSLHGPRMHVLPLNRCPAKQGLTKHGSDAAGGAHSSSPPKTPFLLLPLACIAPFSLLIYSFQLVFKYVPLPFSPSFFAPIWILFAEKRKRQLIDNKVTKNEFETLKN